MVWDLEFGWDKDGATVRNFSPKYSVGQQLNRIALQVVIHSNDGSPHAAWRIWKLLPVKVEGVPAPSQVLSETLGSGSLPSYDGDATRQSSTRAQHVNSERDEFGTIVNEVTVTTTTVHKRYRVEDV